MKKILATICVIAGGAAISFPALSSAAPIDEATYQTVTAQLTAIKNYLNRTYTDHATPLTAANINEIIETGTDWFLAAQENNGHFRYEYLPYEDEYADDDNIVRQAGALYALGELARRDPDKTLPTDDMTEQAISYFERLTKTDSVDGNSFACIVESISSTRCKLGATSLALAGMLGYLDQHPEKREQYREITQNYLAYLIAMKKTDTGFRSVHIVGNPTQSEVESPFFNGEALMTLVRYYQAEPREDIKTIIDDTFLYLKDQPYDSALYLWIMAALKDMRSLWPDETAYTTYGHDFTNWRIDRTSRFRGSTRNYCAYTEGLASAYSLLKDTATAAEKQALKTELDFWNRKNSWLRLSTTDTWRVNQSGTSLSLDQLERPHLAVGGFLTGEEALTQRIDFTQHCLTSYIQTLVDINGQTL